MWYTGASTYGVSLSTQYANERGNTTGNHPFYVDGRYCNDSVTRTTKWVGKVGLIYPSDYGYASEDVTCKDNLSNTTCKNNNWLVTGNFYWTITPLSTSSGAHRVEDVYADGSVAGYSASGTSGVRPSVNLVSDILISGEGTVESPFTFSK